MEIKKNKGYSLVEMIIVLAIVLILAGLALVSLTLVNTARAKDASNKFSSEVNQVRKKAIDMVPSKGNDPYFDETKDYRYGLVLYVENGKYQTDQVVVEKNSSGKYVYKDNASGTGISHAYPAYDTSGNPVRENVKYSSRVEVRFTGKNTSFLNGNSNDMDDEKAGATNTEKAVCIVFDRHGNCVAGAGVYSFYKKNSNRVARVIVRQNGSIEVR